MLLNSHYKKILNYFLGPLLFLAIAISIYRQISTQSAFDLQWQHIKNTVSGGNKWLFFSVVGLMALNWGIEAKKWQILTSHVQQTNFINSLKSVMSGVSFTMLTPNRMGEFLGRVLYLPDGSRIKAATLTMLGSISQLVITLAAGALSLLYLKKWFTQMPGGNGGWTVLLVHSMVFGAAITIIAGLIIYFNVGWFIRQIEKIPPFSKYAFYIHVFGEIHYLELLKILGLSLIRYSVFLLQYFLIFRFFEVDLQIEQILTGTAVLFLMLAIIPTIALAELGVRGQVSIFVFGLFSTNTLEILIATAVIWIINIILPAIAGSFLLFRVKLFKKTE